MTKQQRLLECREWLDQVIEYEEYYRTGKVELTSGDLVDLPAGIRSDLIQRAITKIDGMITHLNVVKS